MVVFYANSNDCKYCTKSTARKQTASTTKHIAKGCLRTSAVLQLVICVALLLLHQTPTATSLVVGVETSNANLTELGSPVSSFLGFQLLRKHRELLLPKGVNPESIRSCGWCADCRCPVACNHLGTMIPIAHK